MTAGGPPRPAAPTATRLHLDLIEVRPGPPAAVATPGLRLYADVADPRVLARLDLGAATAPHDGTATVADAVVRECLAGDVVVDLVTTAASRHLFVVLFPVPTADLPLFDEWFGVEHGPLLSEAAGWARARLVAVDAGPVTRVAVHELEDLDVLDGPERRRAGATAWTRQVFASEWASSVRRHVLRAV